MTETAWRPFLGDRRQPSWRWARQGIDSRAPVVEMSRERWNSLTTWVEVDVHCGSYADLPHVNWTRPLLPRKRTFRWMSLNVS